ncbi:MAG: CDP-diacylglycerol--glycerol-3-phosphate 3-phosphatidyltransferase [Treponema sp.]
MKTSNKFTFSRIILSPVFFIIYYLPIWFNSKPASALSIVTTCIAIPLLAFMEFTDYLDGHFARKHNEVSDFGKMFDPFADVFVHLTTFLLFMLTDYLPPVLFVLILYREFSMNFFRMVAAKKGTAIAARKGGKLKTVFYVASGFFSLAQESMIRCGLDAAWNVNMNVLHTVGIVMYIICVVLSYVSFVDYLAHFGNLLKDSANDKQ